MENKITFENRLAGTSPIILDGGLATQLEAQGINLNTKLWSAKLLKDNRQAIIQAHLAYLEAGAQIITSASYQASIEGFMASGLSYTEARVLIKDAVDLAAIAIDRFVSQAQNTLRPFIAASVGPFGAYLADGSEYSGGYGVCDKTLIEFHQPRLQLLDESVADVLACETIPDYQEALVLADLLSKVQTPAWVSFSCRDGKHINDGTEIEKAVQTLIGHEKVHAIGVNCTAPQYLTELIDRIQSLSTGKAVIVYPNSGEAYDANTKTWLSTDQTNDFIQMVTGWHQQGVDIIGGCCRIGPDKIHQLAIAFKCLNENV